jgi:hypothetical protein
MKFLEPCAASRLNPFGIALALLSCLDASAANGPRRSLGGADGIFISNVDVADLKRATSDFFATSLATGISTARRCRRSGDRHSWDNGD